MQELSTVISTAAIVKTIA